MGLAASQARLLTITARKSDCEFTSMNLSHQKIALARDLQQISDEYQNAMGQTKLVYDFYGSGSSQMDLTYSLMMTPSTYNDYYPKLCTDANERVILNGKFARAARNAGVPAEGLMGTPSSDARNAFIQELANENIIPQTVAEDIQSTIYGNTIGLGDTVNKTIAYETITYDDLMEKFLEQKTNKQTALDQGLKFANGYDEGSITTPFLGRVKVDEDMESATYGRTTFTFCEGDVYETGCNDKKTANYGAKHYNPEAEKQITLFDLLNNEKTSGKYGVAYEGDYVLGYNSQHDVEPTDAIVKLQNDIVGDGTEHGMSSFLQWLTNEFTDIFGGDEMNEEAIRYAGDMVADLLVPDNYLRDKVNNGGIILNEEDDGHCLNDSGAYYNYSYKTDRYMKKDRCWNRFGTKRTNMYQTLHKGYLRGTEQWLGYLGLNGGGSGNETTLFSEGQGLWDGWTYGHRANRNYYGSTHNRSSNIPSDNEPIWKSAIRAASGAFVLGGPSPVGIIAGAIGAGLGLLTRTKGNQLINSKGETGAVLKDYISFVAMANDDDADTGHASAGATMATINLSNIAELFLSYFVDYQNEVYARDFDVKTKYGEQQIADYTNHEYKVCKKETDLGDTNLYANFYDALFNAICTDGWVENGQIDNKDYMQELMKNGMAFITTIGSDGYFGQSDYSQDKYVREVTDTDAIAKAEAKYNTMKAQIQAKEDTIDLKMRNLDTEMSSLTTEYDTIKSLVSKNVEKSFKRYDA